MPRFKRARKAPAAACGGRESASMIGRRRGGSTRYEPITFVRSRAAERPLLGSFDYAARGSKCDVFISYEILPNM